VEQVTPLRKPVLNGTVFAGVGIGMLVAGLLCLVLMHAANTSSDAWLTLGIVGLIVTSLVWPVITVGPNSVSAPGSRADEGVASSRRQRHQVFVRA